MGNYFWHYTSVSMTNVLVAFRIMVCDENEHPYDIMYPANNVTTVIVCNTCVFHLLPNVITLTVKHEQSQTCAVTVEPVCERPPHRP